MRSRTYTTEGVVIRLADLGEADRIVTIFTQDLGKIRAVARGVRRPKSRVSGHLELLYQVTVSAAYGRSLDVITEAETLQMHGGLSQDLKRLSHAVYMCELLDSFSAERSPNYQLYRLTTSALGWLESTDDPWLLVRYFETQLLDLSGFKPELRRCVECRRELAPGDHVFDIGSGGVLCPDCRSLGVDLLLPLRLSSMKVFRLLQREPDFARVGALRTSAPVRSEIERVLTEHLRYVLERRLKSVDFVRLVSKL
jgi:DNA repair protein RecO (recombination protein O)